MSAIMQTLGLWSDDNKRTFLRVDLESGETLGEFQSTTPYGAAKKAIRKSFGKKKKGKKMAGKKTTVFLRETGTKKILKYTGQLVRLDKPRVVELSDGTKITYKYETTVKSRGMVQ